MAVKRYRNLAPLEPGAERQIRIGVDEEAGFVGGEPGEEFDFDYDRPGFNEQSLIDSGLIEVVDKSKAGKEQ